ncbi:hypothetical protein HHI36_006801 [Cryptolaemus montrouzieri]|uniref:Uncharacterized protein n=1 Tax=Cryptolaemus montrouzieri TaxID=559131 RepID=A0ABD2NZ54_9CUCU
MMSRFDEIMEYVRIKYLDIEDVSQYAPSEHKSEAEEGSCSGSFPATGTNEPLSGMDEYPTETNRSRREKSRYVIKKYKEEEQA